jgi:hypothetical protein
MSLPSSTGHDSRQHGKENFYHLIQDEEKIRPPGQGPALLLITLTNTTGDEVLRKTMESK